MPEAANRPMEQDMKLHKLKAGEATGSYLIESPVSEADILLMARQLASQRLPARRTTTGVQRS